MERVSCKKWRKVDIEKGKYMSASQLVMDDGGCSDAAAVNGACIMMTHKFAMGPP